MKKTKKWEKFIYVSNKMKECMKYYKLELKYEKNVFRTVKCIAKCITKY